MMSSGRFKIMRGAGFSLFPNTWLLKHILSLSVYSKPYANVPHPAFHRIEATQENLQCPESQSFCQRKCLSQTED